MFFLSEQTSVPPTHASKKQRTNHPDLKPACKDTKKTNRDTIGIDMSPHFFDDLFGARILTKVRAPAVRYSLDNPSAPRAPRPNTPIADLIQIGKEQAVTTCQCHPSNAPSIPYAQPVREPQYGAPNEPTAFVPYGGALMQRSEGLVYPRPRRPGQSS